MQWLNYHHLYYFWRTAKAGSISRAAQELRLRQPTISAQIASLELSLQKKLFLRQGKKLVLTEEGHLAVRYAEEIFLAGKELVDVMGDRHTGRALDCAVGIVDAVPKLIAYKFLEPTYKLAEPVRLECHESNSEHLLTLLANHKLDMVLSDSPIPGDSGIKGFNHLVGETQIGFFGRAELVRKLRRGFPASLQGAKLLLPIANSVLRRNLEQWFADVNVRPLVMGEFEDSALMKCFGEGGIGIFPAPIAISREIQRHYSVRLLATVPGIVERYYAISLARRIKNPVTEAIVSKARTFLKSRP